MADPLPFENLWDVDDVKLFTKGSRSWVYKMAASGELPCLRLGGLLRFEPEAVRAWARGEAPPAARVVPLPRKPKP